MPVRHAIWRVGTKAQPLREGALEREEILEEMIAADPRIVSDELMLIGRQVDTGQGGRVDLLAVAPDASLIVIELKRNKTPREVVAQALDYASWLETLTPENIADIYDRYSKGQGLEKDFQQRFGHELDEDSLNQSHQMIVVASKLDESSERIVQYLSSKDIPINVLFFQVFEYGSEKLLSRAWLIDPAEIQISASSGKKGSNEPWNGEFYVSFGADEARSWDEATTYGFVSAGGGEWYSKTLQMLKQGDRIWVKIPGKGFVAVGKVSGHLQSFNEFRITASGVEKPAADVLKKGHYHRDKKDDPATCEYFLPVNWIQTLPEENPFTEVGLFGNQNTVCKPTTPKWRHTVERLKEKFQKWEG